MCVQGCPTRMFRMRSDLVTKSLCRTETDEYADHAVYVWDGAKRTFAIEDSWNFSQYFYFYLSLHSLLIFFSCSLLKDLPFFCMRIWGKRPWNTCASRGSGKLTRPNGESDSSLKTLHGELDLLRPRVTCIKRIRVGKYSDFFSWSLKFCGMVGQE